MCELMGLSFDRPVAADFSMREFAMRDVDNADGWGLAWYPDQSLALVKEAVTWRQSGYARFLEGYNRLRAHIYLAHVRHKTTGGSATHADTHPFSRELAGREYCFAHNGTIRGFATLELERYQPLGHTDSEHVFCHLLNEISSRGGALQNEADWNWLHDALSEINQRGTLNCLLSDGQRLFAYRDAQGWKGLCLRKVRFREQGERRFEDCTVGVAMNGEADRHGYVVATRPLSETGWHDLHPGELIVLENGTLIHTKKLHPTEQGAESKAS